MQQAGDLRPAAPDLAEAAVSHWSASEVEVATELAVDATAAHAVSCPENTRPMRLDNSCSCYCWVYTGSTGHCRTGHHRLRMCQGSMSWDGRAAAEAGYAHLAWRTNVELQLMVDAVRRVSEGRRQWVQAGSASVDYCHCEHADFPSPCS